ncbi:MAG: hypothetical protein JWP91_1678 [Fibrobacteres bacterium]|nr:hypothetical protein [Fibrobacterota bacterium]
MIETRMLEWTPERVAKFWDYCSRFPEEYFTRQFGDVMVDRLGAHLKGRRSTLDYGCGTGFMTEHLLDKGYKVTGLDFSRESVRGVDQKFKGRDGFEGAFFVDDVLAQKKRFDAILIFEVIEHLTDEQLEVTMRNLKTLLEPGGVVIMTTPNDERLSDLNIFCPGCDSVFHRWQHVRSWSVQSLSALMKGNGFQVERAFTTNFSLSYRRSFRATLKASIRKALGRPYKDPHLACVCTLAPAGKG